MARTREEINKIVSDLLLKAESTNFGPESEQLIAKAHVLMAKYNIEEAVLHSNQGKHEDVTFIIIPIHRHKKYPQNRQHLLNIVAQQNRCRAVIVEDTMHVVGYKSDCEWVKQLYESLVVVAFVGMAETFDGSKHYGENFLLGFTDRIQRRLKEANALLARELEAGGTSTALVLVDRKEKVQAKVNDLFPNIGKARYQRFVSNPGAFANGDAAAKSATLGSKRSIGSEGPPPAPERTALNS